MHGLITKQCSRICYRRRNGGRRFVLAAPVAALAAGGVGVASHLKNKQLRQEKERLYTEALKKHEANL